MGIERKRKTKQERREKQRVGGDLLRDSDGPLSQVIGRYCLWLSFYLVFISATYGFDEGICEIVCVAVRYMELGHIIPSIRPKSLHFSFPFLSRTMGF